MSPDHPPGLDLDRLRGLLDRERPGLVNGPLTGRLIEGGRSNLTYAVSDGTARWVVRRPPLGHVLATAHDMKREHRVISALHPTAVPVPNPVLLCEDESVLGAPFYVMEFVEGTPYRTADQLAPLGPQRTRDAVIGLVDTLVELHAVDPAAVGLADFEQARGLPGPATAPLGQAVGRVPQPRAGKHRRTARRPGPRTARLPAPTVVHGDYRLDNVLIGPDDRIRAILDWEMSTLGDPLTDLGLLVMYSTRLNLPNSPISTTASAAGHPAAAELVERYAARSGRDVSAVSWYTAFAWFKLAVILEGIHYRYTKGQTVGGGFDRIGELVPVFIEHGLTTLQEG